MYCPKCKGIQKCPCKHCNNKGVVWKHLDDYGKIACGHCGYIFPDFEMEEYRQYEESIIKGE